MQSTRSERYTNTVQFNHKNITRPTITHANKVMAVIADCAKAIKELSGKNRTEQMQPLLQLTEVVVQLTPSIAARPATQTLAHSEPWVYQSRADDDRRQTRSMTQQTQRVQRVPAHVVPGVETPRAQVAAPPLCNNKPKRCKRQ